MKILQTKNLIYYSAGRFTADDENALYHLEDTSTRRCFAHCTTESETEDSFHFKARGVRVPAPQIRPSAL